MSVTNSGKTAKPSNLVSIRPVIEADFEVLAEIRRDTEMQGLLMAIPDATDDDAIRDWISRRSGEAGGAFRVLVETSTNKALGYIQISGIHRRNRTGYGGIAVSKRAALPGLGRVAMQYLVTMAREELGLAKLLAEIRQDNVTAIQLNTLFGYRIVGTLEQHFQGPEQTYDVVLLERLLPTE